MLDVAKQFSCSLTSKGRNTGIYIYIKPCHEMAVNFWKCPCEGSSGVLTRRKNTLTTTGEKKKVQPELKRWSSFPLPLGGTQSQQRFDAARSASRLSGVQAGLSIRSRWGRSESMAVSPDAIPLAALRLSGSERSPSPGHLPSHPNKHFFFLFFPKRLMCLVALSCWSVASTVFP